MPPATSFNSTLPHHPGQVLASVASLVLAASTAASPARGGGSRRRRQGGGVTWEGVTKCFVDDREKGVPPIQIAPCDKRAIFYCFLLFES